MLKVGILKCDSWTKDLVDKHGDVDEQYKRLLHLNGSKVNAVSFDCLCEEYPSDSELQQFDGFIITGSKFSVYEERPWIATLFEQIKRIDRSNKRLVGICFGHQAVAQALGGRVEKVGFNLSYNTVKINADSMRDHNLASFVSNREHLNFLSTHQDQVVSAPPGADIWASNNVCPIQGMLIGDNILTIQAHPEFGSSLFKDLMKSKKAVLSDEQINQAISRADLPTDQSLFADLLVHFFEHDKRR